MKRPPNLDPPPVARRKRALTHEEWELWESVARQAKPLRKRRPKTTPAVDEPAAPPEIKAAPWVRPRVMDTPTSAPPPVPPLAPLGRRERSHLSRGRKEIDARLDLHGMTQERAHRALLNFLHRAQASGMTFVLVITGKGKTAGPDGGRGVLRHQVPQWLGLPELRSIVVGFEEAHIGHGGAGALYVRIRKNR